MRIRNTRIQGAVVFTPTLHHDDRGVFLEAYTARSLREATGRDLVLAQLNVSVSQQGTLRGIHAARTPPGQAKYVQCLAGRILDIVVDLRPDSPTFGQHVAVTLDDTNREAIFIAEGLGHGFCVLSESATVAYATSTPYNPDAEFGINPFDPELDLPWPNDMKFILSSKDREAPPLASLLASKS